MKKSIGLTICTVMALALLPGLIAAKDINPGQAKKSTVKPTDILIGSIVDKKGNLITVKDATQSTSGGILVDTATKILGKDKKTLRIDQIGPKDKVAVISTDSGQMATDGAKLKKVLRVYVKEANAMSQSKRRAVSGVIVAVDGSTITVAHQVHRDRTYAVIVSSGTSIVSKQSMSGTIADLPVGTRVALVGDLGEAGGIIAKRIHIIPGIATGVFGKYNLTADKSATASPTLKISPTATISATPSVTPLATATATPAPVLSPTPVSGM